MKKNRPTQSMKPPSLGLLPPPYSKNASAAQEGKKLSARSRGSSSVPASNCSTSSISRISSSNKMHTDTEQASTSRSEKAGQDGDDGLGSAGKKRRKKKWSDDVRVDLSCCKYEVLRIAIQKMGWQEAVDDKGWHVFWTDTSIGPERLMTLRRGQKVNHFLGMLQICRKKSLARHLSNMRRMFPAEYKFFPRAFILPNHIQDLVMRLNTDRIRTYILKPDNGCQGRGVVLVQNVADLKQAIGGMAGSNMLAQKYLTNPMLLNGFKFDLRIYVLILSCDPLRLFLYREGLVRFCTEKYMKPEKANLKRSCMHLTNYAVNKNNTKFEFNSSSTETDKGSKWTLSSLFKALAAKGYDIGRLKRQMRKMVVMTIISIVPHLIHNYRNCLNEDDNGRSCFELLGMDVLLDEKCRPWLLEVNHSPSFAIDTPLDFKVKESLLSDTLRLLNVDPSGVSRYKLQDKKGSKLRLYGVRQSKDEIEESSLNAPSHQNSKITEYDEFERKNLGNYDRIYPPDDPNLQKAYDIFLAGAEEIFKQSFDMKVKSAILKAQEHRKREEMEKEAAERKKQKKLQNMRKKAQEAAQLAALSQKQRMSLATSSVDLSDIKETLILDMASPRSSVETPTGWERAFNTLDTVPESRGLAQHAEAKPIHVATKRGALEVVKSNLQHEASTNSMGRNFMSDTGTSGDFDSGSMPFQLSVQCNRNPNNDIPTICSPRVSSLPCIVPHSVYRHRIWKSSSYSQVLHHAKKQLVSENVPAQPHFSSRTLLELRRENLAKRNASFASATDCHGSRSPFHLPNVFLAEGRDLFACDDGYRSPFRALSMSANIRGGLKSNGQMWPRHAGSK